MKASSAKLSDFIMILRALSSAASSVPPKNRLWQATKWFFQNEPITDFERPLQKESTDTIPGSSPNVSPLRLAMRASHDEFVALLTEALREPAGAPDHCRGRAL